MSTPKINRRDLMKALGFGVVATGGLSSAESVAAHESLDASAEDLLTSRYIPAKPNQGFHYPYFLYVPKTAADDPRPILVHPNNTGTSTDDYSQHLGNARSRSSRGWNRTLSEALRVPLIVPAFPRPRSEPVDWRHYVHALDTDTMHISSGPLERVDLQVLRMAEYARELLSALEYPLTDSIIMDGFSASGNFVNRFAALHPDEVASVSAGGINGTAVLPIAEDKGHTLNYQIGIADLESVIGEPFDLEAFNSVSQLVYMGGDDENDTIPYGDAWSDKQREIALDVYGEDMIEDRMPYCESVYEDVGADANFKIYDGVGHKITLDMKQDIVALHRQAIGISRIELTERPTSDSKTLNVHAFAFEEDGVSSFEIRVFSDERGELTGGPISLDAGEEYEGEVDLDSAPQAGERITVALLEAGVTDLDQAVATHAGSLADESQLTVVRPPSAGSNEIQLEYAVPADYEAETPIHLFINTPDEDHHVLRTFDPGAFGESTFQVDTDVEGVPFEAGAVLEVKLTDVDTGDDLASVTTTVGGSGDTGSDMAAIEITRQPILDEIEVEIEYSLDSSYSVEEFVRLELSIQGSDTMLLDLIEPGESTTNTYEFPQNPLEAGTPIKAAIRDLGTLASHEVQVLVERDSEDTNEEELGTPTPQFSYEPTNPRAGGEVTFDASGSSSPNGEIQAYAWEFGDDATGAGQTVTHTFESAGTYSITLRITDEEGVQDQLVKEIEVREAQTESPSPTPSEKTASPTETTTAAPTTTITTPQATDTSQPGFGIMQALAGLGGLGYMLKRRLDGRETEGD